MAKIKIPDVDDKFSFTPETMKKAIHELKAEKITPKEAAAITITPVDIKLLETAPIDVMAETQLLYGITKNMIANILINSKGKTNHQLIAWIKLARDLKNDVLDMTKDVSTTITIKKMQIQQAIIESSEPLDEEFKINMIKELQSIEAEYEDVDDTA